MDRQNSLPRSPKSPKKVSMWGPTIRTPVPASPSVVPSSPSVKGGGTSSFFGLLASKRLARRFASRVHARRAATLSQSSGRIGLAPAEPTYRMEPRIKFNPSRVQEVVKELVDMRLKGFSYTAKRSVMMSKILTEEIKEKIKELAFDRYKIVCLVTVGQKNEQGLQISSRCSWDPQNDTSATYSWQNTSAFCCVTVFGIYHE